MWQLKNEISRIKQIRETAAAMARDIWTWWGAGNVELMAAGIAFYSMLSLAPLIAFAISVAGFFVAEAVVEEQLLTTVAEMFGQETAEFLAGVIAAAVRMDASGPLLAIMGLFVTVFFASTVFTSLKLALNAIWDVKAEDIPLSGVLSMVSNRLLAAGMVLLTAVALTLTMLASVMSADIAVWLMQRWPQLSEAVSIYQHSNWVGKAVVVGLMMVAYKVLPDVSLSWRNVFPGALLVTVLFLIGNELLSIYFSLSTTPTVYGAAGSLVILLLWIYYLMYIFFLGALFTRAYVKHVC